MPTNVLMLVRYRQRLSESYLNHLRAKFMEDMKLSKGDFYVEGCLQKVTNEDFEVIPFGESDFYWLNVNFWKPYYGYGYERGDIELYIRSAKWLQENLPDCEVFYGNDVSCESMVPFDKNHQESLLKHRKS